MRHKFYDANYFAKKAARQLKARIKLCKYKKLLGQARTSELLATSPPSIRTWESGKVEMRGDILEAIESWKPIKSRVNTQGAIVFYL